MIEEVQQAIQDKAQGALDKINDKVGDIESNAMLALQKKVQTKPLEDTIKNRMLYAGVGALTSYALGSTIPKLLLKMKLPTPVLVGTVASGAASGFWTPAMSQVVSDYQSGKLKEDEAKRLYRAYGKSYEHAGRSAKDVAKTYDEQFFQKKEAGLAGGAFRLARKGIGATGGALAFGLNPFAKPKNIGQRVFQLGTRGAALGGLGYGGYRLHKRLAGPRSGSNYTTFIRNQVLAGNVSPDELSRRDLVAVRRLGLR